ncbi:uncharacterized protein [Procambarus clarkii]|uniref:uncharacterized protein n=1 Tax=Procambarus clarkii TaxID=6728 RepID=UPI001E678A12|nr:proteoglycan 4-like [Procambarus clarkii]
MIDARPRNSSPRVKSFNIQEEAFPALPTSGAQPNYWTSNSRASHSQPQTTPLLQASQPSSLSPPPATPDSPVAALIHFATELSGGDLRERYRILKELYKENNLPAFVIPEAMFTACSTTTEANPTPVTPANPAPESISTPAATPITTPAGAPPATEPAPSPASEPATAQISTKPKPASTKQETTPAVADNRPSTLLKTHIPFEETYLVNIENRYPRLSTFYVGLKDPTYTDADGNTIP